jgi:hypothetical protein
MHPSSSAGFFLDPSGAFTSQKRMQRGIAKFHSMMMPVHIKTTLRIPQVMDMVKTTAIAPRKEP